MLVKEKLALFGHAFAKVTPACLMMMVQGNLTALALAHWLVAMKTGAITGLILVLFSFWNKTKEITSNNYSMAGLVAFATMIVDFSMHPTHFGGEYTEAITTGVGAGLLWLVVSFTPLGKLGK